MKQIVKKDNFPVFSKKVMLLLRDLYDISFVDTQVNKKVSWKLVYYYKNTKEFQESLNSVLKIIKQ